MEKEKAIAIITARGGSKRIPKKNIKEFCGKPIIAYSIGAAIKSDLFSEVMVSTDSEEIAGIAMQYGANVPFFRSEKASDDYATTSDVLLEVLGEYQKRGREFEAMAYLYPTAPFVTAEKLRQAMEVFQKEICYEVLPVVKFSFPPQRAYQIVDGRYLRYKWEEHSQSRSQDLEAFYHDVGQFGIFDVGYFQQQKGKVREKVFPFIVSELEVQDIDNESDWEIAEIKYQLIRKFRERMDKSGDISECHIGNRG